MKILSENRFSGKTYFYTIASSGLDLVEEGAASEWAREVFLEVLALARKAGDGFISLSDLRSNLGRISSNLTGFATEYWTNWSKLD